MPFEPLNTDERLSRHVKPEKDMDAMMLTGCTGFVSVSLVVYGLGMWPHLAFEDVYMFKALLFALSVGFVPSAIVGAIGIRKFGLPGACGYLAGSMCTGVFLYLRLKQLFLAAEAKQIPPCDYPSVWIGLVPIGWVLACFVIAALILPKNEVPILH